MKNTKKILAVLLAALTLLSVFAFTACQTSSGKTVVKVGVCGANNNQWLAVQKVLDEKNANIEIKLVEFDAYNLPNEALNSGEIDLNAFQHKAYMNNEIANNGYKITAIGDTLIAPLSLYSKKYDKLDDLKAAAGEYAEGAETLTIGVPNDGTNLSRAIKLLETAGLITVKEEAGYTPEIADITGYLYNITISPVDANTLTATLADYAASTINGTYAIPFGLIPSKDALIIEKQAEGGGNPYVNIIAAREADKDNETYKTIVEAYQTQLVAEYLLEAYNEAFFPAFDYNADYTVEDGFVDGINAYTSK